MAWPGSWRQDLPKTNLQARLYRAEDECERWKKSSLAYQREAEHWFAKWRDLAAARTDELFDVMGPVVPAWTVPVVLAVGLVIGASLR